MSSETWKFRGNIDGQSEDPSSATRMMILGKFSASSRITWAQRKRLLSPPPCVTSLGVAQHSYPGRTSFKILVDF